MRGVAFLPASFVAEPPPLLGAALVVGGEAFVEGEVGKPPI